MGHRAEQAWPLIPNRLREPEHVRESVRRRAAIPRLETRGLSRGRVSAADWLGALIIPTSGCCVSRGRRCQRRPPCASRGLIAGHPRAVTARVRAPGLPEIGGKEEADAARPGAVPELVKPGFRATRSPNGPRRPAPCASASRTNPDTDSGLSLLRPAQLEVLRGSTAQTVESADRRVGRPPATGRRSEHRPHQFAKRTHLVGRRLGEPETTQAIPVSDQPRRDRPGWSARPWLARVAG